MNDRNPFEPPVAAVADVARAASRTPIIVLGLVVLLQFAWVAMHAGAYFYLVSMGAAKPIGLLFAIVGLLCLWLATIGVISAPTRGGRLFAGASLLQVGALAWWTAQPIFLLAPLVAGLVLAVAGWWLVRVRARAVRAVA